MCSDPWPLFDRFTVIAGPCVVESRELVVEVASELKKITSRNGLNFVFKASFDKANRSKIDSFRTIGIRESLDALEAVKGELDVPILTDVHETTQIPQVSEVADILQIPAFLCRQTDLIRAAASTGKIVNIKKGQFMAPEDMRYAVDKVRAAGNERVFLTERGTTFGYHNLVVDMRGLETMAQFAPVVFDATHSVQLPGGMDGSSGGNRNFVPTLARAAVAVGVAGVFLETHPDPTRALSDGPNMVPLDQVERLLRSLKAIDALVRRDHPPSGTEG